MAIYIIEILKTSKYSAFGAETGSYVTNPWWWWWWRR